MKGSDGAVRIAIVCGPALGDDLCAQKRVELLYDHEAVLPLILIELDALGSGAVGYDIALPRRDDR